MYFLKMSHKQFYAILKLLGTEVLGENPKLGPKP